jgi:hypothetical protein
MQIIGGEQEDVGPLGGIDVGYNRQQQQQQQLHPGFHRRVRLVLGLLACCRRSYSRFGSQSISLTA